MVIDIFSVSLGIEAIPLREMVVFLVRQVLVGFPHLYLQHWGWGQKHVARMPQMPRLYPTSPSLLEIAAPDLLDSNDHF